MVATGDLLAGGVAADVRKADPERDAIDGVIPGTVIEPHTAEAAAATLAWASGHGLSVVIRGSGTKLAWGAPPRPIDVVLSMRRLNRIVTHRSGDLTVSVEGGITLRELNAALAAHGQQLPIEPPFSDRATIGGLLATNDSGPERHRFGTPRDLVIGIHLATTDGRLARAGGQVVKNVAGYDLSKLVSGSFGGLAAIVGATFKLSPLPAASSTLIVQDLDREALTKVVDVISSSQLEPVAFEVHRLQQTSERPRTRCLLRFASVAAAVDSQVADAAARIGAVHASLEVVSGGAERQLWDEYRTRLWDAAGAVVRVSWLPAEGSLVLEALGSLARLDEIELAGRLAVGAGLVRLGGEPQAQARAIEQLRASAAVGHVVVVRATAEVKAVVDVWGPAANAPLLASVKGALDPRGILGAGRGPF